MAGNLLRTGGHLTRYAGNLLIDPGVVGDCPCCQCLFCTISGRIATLVVSGIASTVYDPCLICPGYDATYGASLAPDTSPAAGVFVCTAVITSAASDCGTPPPPGPDSDSIVQFSAKAQIFYNATSSPVAVPACSTTEAGTSTPLAAGATRLLVNLAVSSEFIDTGVAWACFSLDQSGQIACPFSPVPIPLQNKDVSGVGPWACDLSSIAVSLGVS